MANSGQSTETLAMEGQEAITGIKVRNGIFVRYSVAILLGVFFVSAIVATGVLVSVYSPGTPTTDTPIPVQQLEKFSSLKDSTELRLPTSLIPSHYFVRLQPFINGNYSIHGYVEITFACVEATNNVTLHILDIITLNDTITLTPTDNPSLSLPFTGHTYDVQTQFYVGSLVDYLVAGQTYTLSMNFIGYLNDILVGFYRSSYDEQGTTVTLGTTQFEATDARRAFPCFDEPALKATFTIEMAREDGVMTISNMPRNSFNPIVDQPGWYLDTFDVTLPMSTYLVAFVVSDFVSINSTKNDHVFFRVWARQEAIYQANYALSIGPDVLTFFEGYFDILFPLPKQDMVALPDFDAGAMENWGLITYRETALLYDPVLSGASNKQRVAVVIAHELAHQWFGDLVSPSWWSYIWLNEGFAAYMEYLGTNAVEPTFDMLDQFVVEDLQYVFGTDSMESSHPIYFPVNDPDEINQMFDTITYSKGASIIRMMNYFLTEATFQQGLTNYLNFYAYSTATQDDLWSFLTVQGHADGTLDSSLTVNQIMDTWVLQMGYPVITVTRDSDNGNALVTQERFLLVQNENPTDNHTYIWWVPLTYTTQGNPDFSQTTVMQWMSDTDTQITLTGMPPKSQWIIFNIQQNAYYRVNYDLDNWNALINQLQTDYNVINICNRAQIIDDALDLARSGRLVYDLALSVNSYLNQETEYVPWDGALANLRYLEQMFSWTSGYGSLKKYLLSLLIPLYDNVGFDDNLNGPHLDQLKRSLAVGWTCELDYAPCINNSVTLYAQWMASPDDYTIISPNLKKSVYCTAIAQGDQTQWDFAWDRFLNSNLGTDKDNLLYAMGCSRQLWILQRYLEWAFTDGSGIRRQDSYKVFNSVSGNDYGRDLAWDYLRNEWDNMAAFYGSYYPLGSFTYTVTYEFNTQIQLNELLALRYQHGADLGSATQKVDQAVENVQNNINWMGNYFDVIVKWLVDNGYGKGAGIRKYKKIIK